MSVCRPRSYGHIVITPPPVGDGVLFSSDFCLSFFLSLFLCLFLCQAVSNITRKRLDRFAWNFQGRCGAIHGTTWLNLGSIRVNGSAGRRSTCYGHSYLVWLWSSGSPVLPPSDWECNEIAVLGLWLRGTTACSILVIFCSQVRGLNSK